MEVLAIDINCDMGESFGLWTMGADDEVMPNITSANVACGAHAGDPRVMRLTGRHVKAHGALYNMAARNRALADAIARAIKAFDPSLIMFGLPASPLIDAGLAA